VTRRTSPRVVGIVVSVVGAAASVGAALFLSTPAWGVSAAIILAVATALTAFGLLLIPRESWADKTWPPGIRGPRWNSRTARRQSLAFGAFLACLGVAAAVGVVIVQPGATGGDLLRLGLLAALSLAAGVALIVVGLRPPKDSPDDANAIPRDDTQQGADVIRLGADGTALTVQSVANASFNSLPTMMLFGWILFLQLYLRLDGWLLFALCGVMVTTVVAAILIARRRRSSAVVTRGGSELRVRSRSIAATEVRSALLLVSPPFTDATQRSVTVIFEAPHGFRAPVGVRHRGRRVLSAAATDALVALVESSAIELPHDKDDPRGRFSRALYPNHLTKAQIRDLLENPPADGQPLPVGTGSSVNTD
jgi:hypothetical protein